MPTILQTRRLTKAFAGVQALRGVDLTVRRGEIHALIGHNGAGKSTLVKVLNGVHAAGSYSGEVLLDGEPVAFASPADARRRGIAFVPQEIQALEHLSVAENVFIGHTGLGEGPFVRFPELNRRTDELLGALGIDLDPSAPVIGLSAAERQLMTVGRALSVGPSVLMLDEPTTSLSGPEAERLFAVLRRLHERGVTMIFITHRIPEVMAICDRATVLRNGQVVAEFEREAFREDDIVTAMVGRPMERLYPERSAAPAASHEVLRVEGLSIRRPGTDLDVVSDVSLCLHRGEILGLAGLVGAGRTEVLSAIYGRIPHEGRVLVEGREVAIRRPADARRAGIAMLTEDRKSEGLLFNLPLLANVTIGNLGQVSRGSFVDRGAELAAGRHYIRELGIRTSSVHADVANLSGGNQQKVLLARVLMNAPRVLLLDEPTKGVDVETKQEIYRLVVELADRGVAILLVSSEIPEVLGLSDRCLVIAGGRVVDGFERGHGSEKRVVGATTLVGGTV